MTCQVNLHNPHHSDVGPFVSNFHSGPLDMFCTTVVPVSKGRALEYFYVSLNIFTVGQLSVAIGRRRVRKTFRNGREVKCTAESAAASART